MVSIMTALYFSHLRADDRVSVKPHASPVLHAINYLLGRLDERYLRELRAFGGLQSYPSRTKDPDPVDFSTGSVGIGATATIWSALAHRYVATHFGSESAGRHIALVGDAELDEGAVWEAIVDPMVGRLGDVLWIVDLNRQSLDRVVPDIAAGRIRLMFEAAGWNTLTVKYGSKLRALFSLKGGQALQRRIDRMSNEEYQYLLRAPADRIREDLSGSGPDARAIRGLVQEVDEGEIASALKRPRGPRHRRPAPSLFRSGTSARSSISGPRLHDQSVAASNPGPSREPLCTAVAGSVARSRKGAERGSRPPMGRVSTDSAEGMVCTAAAERLQRTRVPTPKIGSFPLDIGRPHGGVESTQAALGRFLMDIQRMAPELSARIVTVSPDVASSTNLGGWINKVGIWNMDDRRDWFADDRETLLRWKESREGQHIELGIAEVNLVGLLAELGATWSRNGQPLLPIGTLYDPFVTRALEPWAFGIYAGGQSILIGTPSGVTLAPEGGAHQSIITPSVGLEQPGCIAWEPAFGQDLEWTLLTALADLGRSGGTSAYFRLSTRPLDQVLASVPTEFHERDRRRQDVVSGGYRLRQSDERPAVILVGMGAIMPEVLAAATALESDGVGCDVICLTSADLIFRAIQARRGLSPGSSDILSTLFPASRAAPIVSVLDGHPHTLAFLSAINGSPITCLGVQDFGQVGDIHDLYHHYGIDSSTITGAAWDLIDEVQDRAR